LAREYALRSWRAADAAIVHTYLHKDFPGAEIWEVVARYQVNRARESDGTGQTVDIEILHSRQAG
jgi:hypothetical protein